MQTLIQDLKFSLRLLARTPGFTAAAIGVLALGIGLNTGMFTIIPYGIVSNGRMVRRDGPALPADAKPANRRRGPRLLRQLEFGRRGLLHGHEPALETGSALQRRRSHPARRAARRDP